MGSSGAGGGGGGGGGLGGGGGGGGGRGSGGSGGGGGGNGGGGSGGAGHNAVENGRLISVDPSVAETWAAVQGVWSNLSRDWIQFTLSEPGVLAAYRALSRLSVLLVEGRSWDGVAREFDVDSGPGCLKRLVDKLVSSEGADATHEKLKAPLKAALLDFSLRIVGDNADIQDRGDGKAIIGALDRHVFERTSNLFLASYLYENLRVEGKNLSKAARARLLDYSIAKANQIVDAFQRNYHGRSWQKVPQVSHSHLMQIMAGDPDWAVARLRAKVEP